MKTLTNAAICATLFAVTSANILSTWESDHNALNTLRTYATESEATSDRYERMRTAWVSVDGDSVLVGDAFKDFSTEQTERSMTVVHTDREANEALALDGFAYPWFRTKAEPIIPKILEADETHARNAGLNALVTMAQSACEGVIVSKVDYETAGLDTPAAVELYEDVVKTWSDDAVRCKSLAAKLSAAAR